MKNFIFISPHFPDTYYRFVVALKNNGFRVLGIGDAPYDELSYELKEALTEYYLCYDMDSFDNECRAVSYFKNKYGEIDYLESNNEYWLNKDAELREVFNVKNGVRVSEISVYQHKSKMKERFIKAGVKVAPFILIDTFENAINFAKKVGYPLFIKPDVGVGAEGDFKIQNECDLSLFFQKMNKNITYICEQYVTGNIVSFDGIANSKSEIVFATSNVFPPSISDIVEEHKDIFYYTLPKVDDDLLEIGKKVIKAFEVKQRFFHIEFFRLTKLVNNLGDIGDIVALETNMRPAGGYTPDLINYANSVDCYQIYADVMAFDENRVNLNLEKYYAPCASRRDDVSYFYSDEEVLSTFKKEICNHGRYAKVFAGAMGDRFFMARFKTLDEVNLFKEYVERRSGYFNSSYTHSHNSMNLTGEDIYMLHEKSNKKEENNVCDIDIDGA